MNLFSGRRRTTSTSRVAVQRRLGQSAAVLTSSVRAQDPAAFPESAVPVEPEVSSPWPDLSRAPGSQVELQPWRFRRLLPQPSGALLPFPYPPGSDMSILTCLHRCPRLPHPLIKHHLPRVRRPHTPGTSTETPTPMYVMILGNSGKSGKT